MHEGSTQGARSIAVLRSVSIIAVVHLVVAEGGRPEGFVGLPAPEGPFGRPPEGGPAGHGQWPRQVAHTARVIDSTCACLSQSQSHSELYGDSGSGSSITISISHGSTWGRQSSSTASRIRFVCVRTRRSTFVWPRRFLFLEWIQPSMDQLCSHGDADGLIAVSRIWAHCTSATKYRCARPHSNEGIFFARALKASSNAQSPA